MTDVHRKYSTCSKAERTRNHLISHYHHISRIKSTGRGLQPGLSNRMVLRHSHPSRYIVKSYVNFPRVILGCTSYLKRNVSVFNVLVFLINLLKARYMTKLQPTKCKSLTILNMELIYQTYLLN